MSRASKIIHEAMEERRPYDDYEDAGFYLHNADRDHTISGPNTEEEAHRQKYLLRRHHDDDLHVLYKDTEGRWNYHARTYPFMPFDDDPDTEE